MQTCVFRFGGLCKLWLEQKDKYTQNIYILYYYIIYSYICDICRFAYVFLHGYVYVIVRVSLSIPGKCVIRHMPSSRLRTAEAELQEASKREQVRTPGDVESARFFFFFSHRTHLVNLVNSVGFIGVFVSIHIHTKKFHWAKRGLKLKIMTGVLVYTSPKKRLDQNGGYIYISMEFFFIGTDPSTHQPVWKDMGGIVPKIPWLIIILPSCSTSGHMFFLSTIFREIQYCNIL